MLRSLHRWPGLVAILLLVLLTLSGAALSVFPMLDSATAQHAEAGLSVAELAARVQQAYPGVEQIRRAPSGRITAYWFSNDAPGAAVIDPATGKAIASADPNPVQRWLTTLHRSLFLDDGGRLVTGAGAAAMLFLSLSGIVMVARRAGGWRRWFAPLKGPVAGRLHVEIARFSVLGLTVSSVTALWMTASTFGLLPDQPAAPPPPTQVSGGAGSPVGALDALLRTPVNDLRDLSFPAAGDAGDVFTLKTNQGSGFVDQGTGALLSWNPLTPWQRVSETVYMLHTGHGAAALGLLLGLMALGVPVLAVTGTVVWLSGRRSRPRMRGTAKASAADTIVLVGSESGTTWGYAAALQAALRQAGQQVHVGPMSAFAPSRYRKARQIILLAATYGNGDVPQSAKGFLHALAALDVPPRAPVAILGFGDSSFPSFCGFARAVEDLAAAKGWRELLPLATVDRQSAQDFASWGEDLGNALGVRLALVHQPRLPATTALTLVSRRDYGADVQAPTAILRFAIPETSLVQRLTGKAFGAFEAGDLLGVLPAGSSVPRFYSLASSRSDGFIEIVVRKHRGGLCSGQLLALEPGDRLAAAFVRQNPAFRAGSEEAPLILIGAGSGIGPLAGFIRGNAQRRPVHLFFGMRHPASDFLYGEELAHWQRDGRLTRLTTAASRSVRAQYVQDALRAEALELARLLHQGARVMVCGGRDMAEGVGEALSDILGQLGLSPSTLKAEGRYVEDVY